jgi:hypothetical protein
VDLWGEGQRQETRGLVVDLCAACAGLQSHWLCELFDTDRVAHLDVGRGVYASTWLMCARCSKRTEIDPARHLDVIAPERSGALVLSEGLSLTNPRVARALDALALAAEAGAAREMIEKAEAVLFAKRDLDDVVEELENWSKLTVGGHERLSGKIHQLWQVAGGPERPRVPIQPGEAGFATPTRPGSVLRSIDRKVVIVAVILLGVILLIIASSGLSRKQELVVDRASGPPEEIQWVDYGLTAISLGSFITFFVWRRMQRRTMDDLRRKAGIDP